jgi:hypothetical protein
MNEPNLPAPQRPCSTPHSAPLEWLRPCPERAEGDGDPAAAVPAAQPQAIVEQVLADPQLLAEVLKRAASTARTERTRSDGWTGERIATFLQVLADTGIVTEACRTVGMCRDSAYELRNRDPIVAAAWAVAQSKARPLVADGLLERSITGTVEHYYRDGVLVGERRHYESWLGLAVLKRLDRLAEQDRAEASLSAKIEADWGAALDALREGGSAAVAPALEPKTDEPDTPPIPPGYDPRESVWRTDDGTWVTTFPPPPGFEGTENRPYDGDNYYERACTAEEADLLDANAAAGEAEERAEVTAMAEAERDAFFAELRMMVPAPCHPGSVGPACGVAQDAIEREPALPLTTEERHLPDQVRDEESDATQVPDQLVKDEGVTAGEGC